MAVRESTYNARGWKLTQSEWGTDAPSPHVTEFKDYDPFGRAAVVETPDGKETLLEWTGYRKLERTEQVNLAGGPPFGEGPATTVEEYYKSGRLRRVFQHSGPNGEEWETYYNYDEAGRLAQVLWYPVGPGNAERLRRWNYDDRGLLLEKREPEFYKGGSDNLTYHYFGRYDALGRGQVVEGSRNNDEYLKGRWHEYDRAGRLVKVRALAGDGASPQPGALLKEFVYAGANAGDDLKLGKLESSVRYNSHGPSVEQRYRYRGLGGRVDRRQTYVGGEYRFRLLQSWTEFGALDTLTYPTCIGCSAGAPARTLTFDYSVGRLTGIDGGWLSDVLYQPNGLVSEIRHANGRLVDHWTPDPHDMARPSRIFTQFSNGSPLFDTGTYSYDGAGNIKTMGDDSFFYDKVQRIVQSVHQVGTTTQSYTYNPQGELTAITTDGVAVTVPRDNNDWDRAGNFVQAGPRCTNAPDRLCTRFEYDRMDKLASSWDDWEGATRSYAYVYDADDERVMRLDNSTTVLGGTTYDKWDVRDLDGRLLRTFTENNANQDIAWKSDYIYRGSALLAKDLAVGGRRHVHLDHLGTIRLETENGSAHASFAYYPYGEPILTRPEDGDPAYTGHQRDDRAAGGIFNLGDLDYMHARHYMPAWGRFLQVDPAHSAVAGDPQTWSKWAYVRGNPMRYVDPNGRVKFDSTAAESAYREAREYLVNSKRAGKIIQQYEAISGDQEPSLAVSFENDRAVYHVDSNKIIWNPTTGVDVAGQGGRKDSSGGTIQSAALTLLHEIVHNLGALKNRKAFDRRMLLPDAAMGDLEEREANKAANKAAKQLDEPTTGTDDGRYVRTGCVTCKKEKKEEEEKEQ